MIRDARKRTRIIAEACANHLGDKKIQEDMVWAAADAGADYIKFQSWKADSNTRGQSEAMKPYELSDDDHHRLMEVAKKAGIGFSTTVFNRERIPFVASLDLDFIKVASPDCGSVPFLRDLAKSFPKVIVSTGMSDKGEIAQTVAMFHELKCPLSLLHCMYPLVDGHYHLRRMDWLRQFVEEVGLSDHSKGEDLRASKLAIGMGADWIERHFILDRKMPAKDAAVSIDVDGLRELVQATLHPQECLAIGEQNPELLGDVQPELSERVRELRSFYVGRWGVNV